MTGRAMSSNASGRGRRRRSRSTTLPILMYHGIHSGPDDHGAYSPLYSISAEVLASQLDWLGDNGYHTRLLTDSAPRSNDVVLTFDDGDASVMSAALPLLAQRGMVAEFCIPSDFVGRPGQVTASDVRRLAEAGMGVMSHGRSHEPLTTLTDSELAEELRSSKRALEMLIGKPVVGLSAPGGRAGPRELRAARSAGFEVVLNSVPGPNRRRRPDRYLHRISVTRDLRLREFGQLVQWRGKAPWRLVTRTAALEAPKRVLGDARYVRIRARLLSR